MGWKLWCLSRLKAPNGFVTRFRNLRWIAQLCLKATFFIQYKYITASNLAIVSPFLNGFLNPKKDDGFLVMVYPLILIQHIHFVFQFGRLGPSELESHGAPLNGLKDLDFTAFFFLPKNLGFSFAKPTAGDLPLQETKGVPLEQIPKLFDEDQSGTSDPWPAAYASFSSGKKAGDREGWGTGLSRCWLRIFHFEASPG